MDETEDEYFSETECAILIVSMSVTVVFGAISKIARRDCWPPCLCVSVRTYIRM